MSSQNAPSSASFRFALVSYWAVALSAALAVALLVDWRIGGAALAGFISLAGVTVLLGNIPEAAPWRGKAKYTVAVGIALMGALLTDQQALRIGLIGAAALLLGMSPMPKASKAS